MKVIHINGYAASKQQGFEGFKIYLIACCGMCTFPAMESVSNASAKTFASAIMKIMLQYGLSHTVVLDKDSKFLGVCQESLDLLHINCHILSGGNHNPMLVKRINCFLNKGLKIMTNKHDSIRVALEAILLLIYAWISCPVPGTDISRSLVAVGCKFRFPINFSSGKAATLISAPGSVEFYSRLLVERLRACHKVALLLVCEQRCWHHQLVHSRRQDHRTYNIGDIVFARQATHSDSKCDIVDKLMYAFTGQWHVTASLPGASYALPHVHHPTLRNKKHASNLSLYPVELIPFQPLDGADTRYGQLYKPIGLLPFKEAGLNGFQPSKPFHIASHLLQAGCLNKFHWPTLSKLNEDIIPFPWSNNDERCLIMDGDHSSVEPILYNGPSPSPATYSPRTIPPISSLIASILSSSDRLFFISHSLENPNTHEWRLVQVAFLDSTSLSPSCLQDGWFIVKFYTLHHNGVQFNASNQRYWLQYHHSSDIATPTSSTATHLIQPSDTLKAHATQLSLVPFRRWVNLTHSNTFIHGPFSFAVTHGRQTCDCISKTDWDTISSHSSMFTNPLPSSDLPSYSIHVDRGVHISYCNISSIQLLLSVAVDDNVNPVYL
jgi:hypothetical protein